MFFVRGNHEENSENISTYKEANMFGWQSIYKVMILCK